MKLTKEHREGIIKQAIADTFKKRDDAHAKARTNFIDALYAERFGDIEKIAKKLPKEWVSSYHGIKVEGAGFRRWTDDVGVPQNFSTSKDRLWPMHISRICVDKTSATWPLVEALQKEHHAIEAAKVALRADLVTLLYGCSTVAKLLEAWPSGVKYFPAEKVKVNLPVPITLVKKVNALMGLPA